MPPRTPTAPEKRRSRTGCLTCRTRRRKCDERRPQCENCEAKGLSCRYGANVTFVEPNTTVPLEPSRDKGYSRIKFVGDGSSASVGSLSPTAPPTFSAELDTEKDGHSPNDDVSKGGLHGGRSLDRPGGNGKLASGAHDPANRHYSTFQASLGDGICLDSATADFNRPTTSAVETVTPSSRLEEVSDVSQLPGRVRRGSPGGTLSNASTNGTSVITNHEVDLLRHYRYHIAPWLDLGDSKSTFGIAVLINAKEDYFLYHAILALAARQRWLRRAQPRQENVSDEASVQDCQNKEGSGSSSEQLPISSTTHLLLSLDKVLSSEPRSWSSIIRKCVPTFCDVAPHAFDVDVKAAVFWMLFRIDLAASLFTAKPLLLPYSSCLPAGKTLEQSSPAFAALRSPGERLQHAMFLLARATTLTFANAHSSSTGLPDTSHGPPLSSRWMSLWTENQNWRLDSPPELQQILEVKGELLDRVDPESNLSFPIIIFTTALALIANVCHHLTCLLLLTHKPRLVKLVAVSRYSTSAIWHAQCIAGIALSTDSPESWDPILISGLLRAARYMSHSAQQTAIIDILNRVKLFTGFQLDGEIETLRSEWLLGEQG